MKNIVFALCIAVFSASSFAQNTEKIYTSVDKAPILKKERGNIQKYIYKNLQYPVDALGKEIEGLVMVTCNISSEGKISNIEIEKGVSESINNEALRIVETMQKWKPAELNNKAVATKLSIPIKFYLNEESRKLAEQIKPFYANNKVPMFVIDNKKVTGLTSLEYYNIKSIRVIKGKNALKLYGDDAKHGVLVIETKNGTRPDYQFY